MNNNAVYEENRELEEGIDAVFRFQEKKMQKEEEAIRLGVSAAEHKIRKKQKNLPDHKDDIADLKEQACLKGGRADYSGSAFFEAGMKKTREAGYQDISRKAVSAGADEAAKGIAGAGKEVMVKAGTGAGSAAASGGAAAGAAAGTAAVPGAGTLIGIVVGHAAGSKLKKQKENMDDVRKMAKAAKDSFMREERIKMTLEESTSEAAGRSVNIASKAARKVVSFFNTILVSAMKMFPILIPIFLLVMVLILIVLLISFVVAGSITENELSAGKYLDDMVYYSQLDPEWYSYAYGSGTIGTSGCGITCMAMCAATFVDSTVTPPDMAVLSMKNGGYVKGQGSAMSIVVSAAARQYDMRYQSISPAQIKAYIEKYDALIIWGCRKGTFSNSDAGHVMIIRAAGTGDEYYLADPAHEDRNTKKYMLKDITSQAKGYYYAVWSDEGRLASDMEDADYMTEIRKQIVSYAKLFLGNPYKYGGTSLTEGTDCSGFTLRIFEHFGIGLPRTAAEQYQQAEKITPAELKPGDLCFYTDSAGNIGHVSMYMGNNKVIHASNVKTGIIISDMNYREAKYYGRYIDDKNMGYTEEDLLYLSAVMDAESSGFEANTAVGYCVINRKKSALFPGTVKGVVEQNGQFTSAWRERVSGTVPISSTAQKAAKAVLLGSVDNPIGDRVYFRNIPTYEKNAGKSGWHSPVYIYQAYDTNRTQGNVFFKEKNEQ